MTKLSEAQRDVLQRITDGEELKWTFGSSGAGSYYWSGGKLHIQDGRTVSGLEKRALVQRVWVGKSWPRQCVYALTDAGRAALAESTP